METRKTGPQVWAGGVSFGAFWKLLVKSVPAETRVGVQAGQGPTEVWPRRESGLTSTVRWREAKGTWFLGSRGKACRDVIRRVGAAERWRQTPGAPLGVGTRR